jgi:hypothetical protein
VGRRLLLVIAGWLGAAALATVMGLGAISVIGAGLTSSDNRPRTEAEVADLLAAASPSASARAGGEPSASAGAGGQPSASARTAAPPGVVKTFATRAGTITARCAGDLVQVVSMSPAQGYAVHDGVHGELRASAEAEFRGVADDHDRVKARLRCASNVPSVNVSVRDD